MNTSWPTGTLTENRMTVVEGWFAGHKLDHTPTCDELSPDLMTEIKLNIALSSKVCGFGALALSSRPAWLSSV